MKYMPGENWLTDGITESYQFPWLMLSTFIHPSRRTFWYPPRIQDIQTLMKLAQTVTGKEQPVLLDVGSGIGLMAYLFAREGFEVIAIDQNESVIERSKVLYKHPRLQYLQRNMKEMEEWKGMVDVVFNSWMPAFSFWGKYLFSLDAPIVYLVGDPGGATGDYKCDEQKKSYRFFFHYLTPSWHDLLSWVNYLQLYPLTEKALSHVMKATNQHICFLHRQISEPEQLRVPPAKPYPWENQLDALGLLPGTKVSNGVIWSLSTT
ncbi:class I SAM-dependent methyltransferase [Microaerobacter geothermalis]|uniref:class I SAM-dependent methyltransferase n=1 Tax=Microaerobacter geothermalis TaxID=674972 RepID=UPI001F44871F|nr:class I SAM-dependent methyltransferase [Microaerobacter geothermalis]MCF6093557.1 class I SAM-dependent methyltransferase [Microaerobacter geothermalis]